jgi:hypothetical protein
VTITACGPILISFPPGSWQTFISAMIASLLALISSWFESSLALFSSWLVSISASAGLPTILSST